MPLSERAHQSPPNLETQTMKHIATLIVLPLALAALALAPPASGQTAGPDARLHELFERGWEQDLRNDPLSATYYGDTRYNHLWPDLGEAQRELVRTQNEQMMEQLSAMDTKALSPADRLNHELFVARYQRRLDAAPFHLHAFVISARRGPQVLNEIAEVMPFASVADYETWLARLEALPQYLQGYEAMLRQAAAEGRTQPRHLMERVLPQLDLQLVDSAQDSPFYERFADMPEGFTRTQRRRLQRRARSTIESHVIPAYRRFATFFRDEYLPACRTTVGVWDVPDGEALYRNRAAFHTTTDMTPEQIHQTGLREVARIRAEMRKVMREVQFQGSLTEFFEHLRTDPQFYYEDPEELFRAYVVASKLIEPELPRLFGRLYRTPFGVRRIPMTSAPNTTTAYYSAPSQDGTRAGYYYVNLYRPEVRPKYEIEVLTAHEAAPGHHLQIALAREQRGLPQFRRFGSFTSYVEGWALYSERLGYDLGLYKDPYSRFGQLTYDMWRAVRLVVDTGIHQMRWSRQRAIDYFLANAPKTEADIINEIDRYIGWPGQALAYKIGQLKILELRADAERELGDDFDIRAFHDQLLATGAVPLATLERLTRAWIAETKAAR